MQVAIMGAPGAGKGTQARLLAERLTAPHISTGDILRAADATGSALGRQARTYMDAGRLVPDEVIVGIVEERLQAPDCAGGYILDGFPRTVPQAEALEGLGHRLDTVIELVVPREELLDRLGGRRVCRGCGTMYHLVSNPPRHPQRCDRCGGELYQRDDDLEQTIQHRLDVYERETARVLAHYRAAGILKPVVGTGSREEVFRRVTDGLR